MRQRNVKNCDEILSSSDKYVEDLKDIDTNKYEKMCLEIGIGKGAYIAECARRHPENLYIGIELNKGVVSLATKKIARFEKEVGKKLENLKVLAYNALELNELFDAHTVDRIYLNFSDPWPKKKHEKRRLTSDAFLAVYKNILKNGACIEFKTDNRSLFEYSLKNMNKNKMSFEYLTLNLHDDIDSSKLDGEEPNIMTEYEEKFMANGPIYKLITKFN